jgi:CBS domain-containing protein
LKVEDIMTSEVKACRPESDLATAAMIMWERDCGSVPVVNGAGIIVGIITDRDICMAVAFNRRPAFEITVGEIVSGTVYACAPDDDIEIALQIMREQKLRRLPVVSDDGALRGILSINDVILHSKRGESKKGKHVSHKDVMITLKALSEHRASGHGQIAFLEEDNVIVIDLGDQQTS